MTTLEYWKECISLAADDAGLTLTDEQITALAESAKAGHENIDMAFYSPPPSDRINAIEREWKVKYDALKAEFERYRENAESAVKTALGVHREDQVSIGQHSEVFRHGGRTTQIQ